MIHPDLRSREELIDFLWWKGSTHVIAHSNAKGMNQNSLKTTNRGKNKRGKNKNAKNKTRITKSSSQIESRRTRGGKGHHSRSEFLNPYTNLSICGPLSQEP